MGDRTWDRMGGLAVGVVLGLVAGLLLAPRAGDEMRRQLRNKAQDSVDQIRHSVVDLQKQIREQGRSWLNRETPLQASRAATPDAQTDTPPEA
ncbi:MAG: YtxH domain-containing protein [Actinomycetia bacterium]|nr:YtxH domain-containing protein [Actinomycetes bacterium]